METRKLIVKVLQKLINILTKLVDRFTYQTYLKEWEIQKHKEGFPKEWFNDNI